MTQTVILSGSSARKIAHGLIDKLPDGSTAKFDLPKRTLDQNAKMQAMLSDIARAKPMGRVLDAENWKGLFMAEAGFKVRFEPSLYGDGVVCLGYRSSRLTKAEFSDLIECIYAFGEQHGVRWSEPGAGKQKAA